MSVMRARNEESTTTISFAGSADFSDTKVQNVLTRSNAAKLDLESTLRPRGRPRNQPDQLKRCLVRTSHFFRAAFAGFHFNGENDVGLRNQLFTAPPAVNEPPAACSDSVLALFQASSWRKESNEALAASSLLWEIK